MIKILHLYYDLLNLYGEYGNIVVLCDNLRKNNIGCTVDELSVGDDINFNNYDFIYCGSGSEFKTDIAFNDFINRKDDFINALEKGKHILFTGSSLMLLGKTYCGKQSVGVFDFDVTKGDKRINGDMIVSLCDYKAIVGYLNTSFVVVNNDKKVVSIIGSDINLKDYDALGFTKINLLTINITGPLLIKNPYILKDYIIKLGNLACNNSFEYKDTINKLQYDCFNVTLNELKNRFSIK